MDSLNSGPLCVLDIWAEKLRVQTFPEPSRTQILGFQCPNTKISQVFGPSNPIIWVLGPLGFRMAGIALFAPSTAFIPKESCDNFGTDDVCVMIGSTHFPVSFEVCFRYALDAITLQGLRDPSIGNYLPYCF